VNDCSWTLDHPMHLVHPKTGEHMLFDALSEAMCPSCGARWRRILNVVKLVEGPEPD
jgi:hypothetical protein